jgi:hypothetical protein
MVRGNNRLQRLYAHAWRSDFAHRIRPANWRFFILPPEQECPQRPVHGVHAARRVRPLQLDQELPDGRRVQFGHAGNTPGGAESLHQSELLPVEAHRPTAEASGLSIEQEGVHVFANQVFVHGHGIPLPSGIASTVRSRSPALQWRHTPLLGRGRTLLNWLATSVLGASTIARTFWTATSF